MLLNPVANIGRPKSGGGHEKEAAAATEFLSNFKTFFVALLKETFVIWHGFDISLLILYRAAYFACEKNQTIFSCFLLRDMGIPKKIKRRKKIV